MTIKDPVVDAVDSWQREGLIDESLHAQLRARAEEEALERRQKFAGQFITGTGGALLIVAFVVLTTIFWDDLTEWTRAAFLWAITLVVLVLGRLRLANMRTDRVGTVLVLVALPLAMFATGLVRAWRIESEDWVVALSVVATAVLIGFTLIRDMRHNPVLLAASLAAALIFAPIAAAILEVNDMDAIWVALDVVVVAVLAGMGVAIFLERGAREVARGGREALFAVAFVASAPLVPLTWFDVLEKSTDTVPILAFAVLAVAAVALGLHNTRTSVVILGSLLGVGDAWYFGISQGQAFGTFFALFVSALVLFWLGSRLGIGRKGKGPNRNGPGRDADTGAPAAHAAPVKPDGESGAR